MKRRLIYTGIIILSILTILIYYSRQGSTKVSIPTSTVSDTLDLGNNLMVRSDTVVPTYKDFLNDDLQKVCPFYEPSGVAYRDCLVTLLENREKAVDQTYVDIVGDLRIIHEKDVASFPTDGDLQWPARQSFLENLAILYKTWKPYRDALCITENSDAWGGSGQSGFINECRLYQTALFEAQLLDWRHDWIGGDINNYPERE